MTQFIEQPQANAGKISSSRLGQQFAKGIQLGQTVSHHGELWVVKGYFQEKIVLYQEGRGGSFAIHLQRQDKLPEAPTYSELVFQGAPENTRYFINDTGVVYQVHEAEDGSYFKHIAHDVRLIDV